MAQVIKDVVTWLKQWFYTESEIDTITGGLQTQINNKADSTTVSNLATTVSGKADKTGGVAQITDTNAHTYINTSANDSQATINTAIDTAIGNLQSIKAIEVTSDKGTASSDKLGKLFIVNENNKVNVYYVKQTGTGSSATYSWEKMDTNILDELVVNWSDVQNKPSSFTPSSHTHGNIQNNGTFNGTRADFGISNYPLIVDYTQSNLITTGFVNTTFIFDSNAHSHIGTQALDSLDDILTAIDTAISGKSDKTATIGTTITLVDKGETNEGCIIFNTIS
jgi:hypothetical protein